MTVTATTPLPIPESPYPGIEAFRYMDQQIFAARDEEIWNLQSSVTIYRAVLVYGDSGTGKSSLINAGFIPRIMTEDYLPDRLRVQPRAGKEIKVERMRVSAGPQAPFLPSNFARDENSANFEISIETFMSRLLEFKKAAQQNGPDLERRPLLIFDQFEEFITLFEEAMRGEQTGQASEAVETQKKILTSLVELIKDDDLPVKMLFVFREDYLAKLNILFENYPRLLDQYLRLLPPRVEDLKQIIRAPFEKEELRGQFMGEGRSELTEALAEQISAELQKRNEGGRVNLSELQIVCRRLWESNDPAALFKEKGIQGLLEQYLSAAVGRFPEDLRDPAVALLGQMITSSNTRNIISQDDLVNREKENFSRDRIEQALKALIESKLVLREPRRKVYFYEIVSEFLVPWIKQQQAARQAFVERRKLEEESARKLEIAQREKRKLFFVALIVVVILILLVATALLIAKNKESQRAQLQAEVERDEAMKVTRILTGLASESPEARLKALNEAESLLKDESVPRQIKEAILSIGASDADPSVDARATELIESASKSNKELAQSLTSLAQNDVELAAGLPPRFYIHLSGDEQVPRYEKLKAALEERGYVVPPYEIVSGITLVGDQVRCFRPEDGERAKAVAELLTSVDRHPWTPRYIRGYEKSARIRTGHFELWLAPDRPAAPQSR